jgi:hypothetical protein
MTDEQNLIANCKLAVLTMIKGALSELDSSSQSTLLFTTAVDLLTVAFSRFPEPSWDEGLTAVNADVKTALRKALADVTAQQKGH